MPAPKTKVIAIAPKNKDPLCCCAPMLASPQVKLESRRHAVSSATLPMWNKSRPLGPPAVELTSTAYVAKNAENITMSLSRKIQKPYPTMIRFVTGRACRIAPSRSMRVGSAWPATA